VSTELALVNKLSTYTMMMRPNPLGLSLTHAARSVRFNINQWWQAATQQEQKVVRVTTDAMLGRRRISDGSIRKCA
jgi:hypothetical protein